MAEIAAWGIVAFILLNLAFVAFMWWRAARRGPRPDDDVMRDAHGDLPKPFFDIHDHLR